MSLTSKPIGLALIGCGGIAQTHLEAISKVPRIELRAVYDIHPDTARKATLTNRARVARDLSDIWQDPFIESVLICTPPATHRDLILDALKANKHVLCEKPFTIHSADTEAIKKLAKRSKKLVMMASKFRFVKDVIEARKLVQSGAIGDIVLSEVIFCSMVNMENRWNSNPKIAGGGVLIDNGSHAVDVIRYVVGPIKSVYAQAGKRAQRMKAEDTARLHFETEDGIIGMVDLSWSLYKHTASYVNIFGTKGTIEVGWKESLIWDPLNKTSKVFGEGYKKLDAFVSQIEHFADCVRHQTQPILGLDDALESVRVIEAAYTSIREKKWLRVN